MYLSIFNLKNWADFHNKLYINDISTGFFGGFKELYGDTIYAYLLDHKMEEARRMLNSQKYNVNEVGLKLGYSTASHFIAAFKKKYGTTPKKYLGSVSS